MAVGNRGADGISPPSDAALTIGVGAVDATGTVASFSSIGEEIGGNLVEMQQDPRQTVGSSQTCQRWESTFIRRRRVPRLATSWKTVRLSLPLTWQVWLRASNSITLNGRTSK